MVAVLPHPSAPPFGRLAPSLGRACSTRGEQPPSDRLERTTTVRGIASEAPVGPEEGLATDGVISCDNLITVPKDLLDSRPVGVLGPARRGDLDRALRYALDIVF